MNLNITQNYLEKNKIKIEFINGKYYINLPEDVKKYFLLSKKSCIKKHFVIYMGENN
jgi:hypothetical protein